MLGCLFSFWFLASCMEGRKSQMQNSGSVKGWSGYTYHYYCGGGCEFLVTLIRGTQLPSVKECIFFFFNLQGLSFIICGLPKVAPGPWFFTVIMFCYLATVGYHICRKHIKNLDKILFGYSGIIPLTVFILLVFLRVNLNGLLAYMVGFGLKKRKLLEKKRIYNIFISMVVFILAVGIRLVTKRYIDGSVLYDQILAPVTHIMIAAAFFIGCCRLLKLTFFSSACLSPDCSLYCH